ncbi:hypothetical protein BJ684DRAFT_15543, partial [Piptocephalis cylindrospora]
MTPSGRARPEGPVIRLNLRALAEKQKKNGVAGEELTEASESPLTTEPSQERKKKKEKKKKRKRDRAADSGQERAPMTLKLTLSKPDGARSGQVGPPGTGPSRDSDSQRPIEPLPIIRLRAPPPGPSPPEKKTVSTKKAPPHRERKDPSPGLGDGEPRLSNKKKGKRASMN